MLILVIRTKRNSGTDVVQQTQGDILYRESTSVLGAGFSLKLAGAISGTIQQYKEQTNNF